MAFEHAPAPAPPVREQDAAMRILLLDNYDSYTYNLFQQLARLAGSEPLVVVQETPRSRVHVDTVRLLLDSLVDLDAARPMLLGPACPRRRYRHHRCRKRKAAVRRWPGHCWSGLRRARR